MSLQNRVSPDGEILAVSARGTMFGNRGGCFHRPNQTLKVRPFATKQWICCVLEFKHRRRKVMSPGLYTELFFLDEATAIAAGHRPCFECRRADAKRFAEIWQSRTGTKAPPQASEMDHVLHSERIDPSTFVKSTFQTNLDTLPDLTFVRWQGSPHIVWQRQLRRWHPDHYGHNSILPPSVAFDVLTPATMVAQLAAGFTPSHHPSLANAD